MARKKIFGFEANIFWMGLTSFFTDVGSEMIYPVLPIFISSVLGVNKAFIGLIEGIAEATSSLLKIASGWLSDKLGKRKGITVFGYSLSTIAKPFLALSTSGWHVLGLRFLDRLGKGVRGAPRDALIADSCEQRERGKAFGFHRAMDTAGAILGPALAFILLPLLNGDIRKLFLISAIPATVAVILLIIFVKEKANVPSKEAAATGAVAQDVKPGPILKERKFIIFTAIFTIFTLGNSSDAFIILKAVDMKVSAVFVPLLWVAMNTIYTLVALPAGRLSDKIGRKTLLVAGMLVFSIVYFGFSSTSTPLAALLLFSLYGLYYGMTEGVWRAMVSDLVPAGERATAYGIFTAFTGVALLFASLIMGGLWQAFGPAVAFSFGATVSLVCSFLLVVLV